MQRFVKQDAGIIAGEWPAGAIGAVHARRQADNQQPRLRITEGRDRTGVVVGMALANAGEELGQSRAGDAIV